MNSASCLGANASNYGSLPFSSDWHIISIKEVCVPVDGK